MGNAVEEENAVEEDAVEEENAVEEELLITSPSWEHLSWKGVAWTL